MLRTPSSFMGNSHFHLKFDEDERYIQIEKNYFKNKQALDISDYDKDRANIILNYFLVDDNKDRDIKILESTSCFRGVAFRNNTIMYILYCD